MKFLYSLITVLFISAVLLTGCNNKTDDSSSDRLEVTFNDRSLESVVRAALGKPEGVITPRELRNITRLDLSKWFIQDLTGLEFCTNLEYLDLDTNKIRDISALVGMTGMKELHLTNNEITDISPGRNDGNDRTVSPDESDSRHFSPVIPRQPAAA